MIIASSDATHAQYVVACSGGIHARFDPGYVELLQTWVNAILRWRSGKVENGLGPVEGPDAWDGYRAAIVAQTVLVSMSRGGSATVESISLPELYRRCRAFSTSTRLAG